MSHCISVFLTNKHEVQSDSRIKFKELEQGIVVLLDWPGIDLKDLLADRLIASISTEYFGGFGNQSASVTQNGEVIYEIGDEEFPHSHPINEALRLLGVKAAKGMDEFDTIGLGNYRSNEDFYDKSEEKPKKSLDSIVLSKMKNEGFDYCFRHYSSFNEIEDSEFHRLREAYIEAAEKLEKYIRENTE